MEFFLNLLKKRQIILRTKTSRAFCQRIEKYQSEQGIVYR